MTTDPMRHISARMNKTVSSVSGLQKEYETVLQVTKKALDKLAEITRGMDELDMLSRSIQESREKLTRMTGELRAELGAGVSHLKEGQATLGDVKDSLYDDATLLMQKMKVLYQSNPEMVTQALTDSTEYSLDLAIAHLDEAEFERLRRSMDKRTEGYDYA